jgi:HEAT repeat protein
MRIPRPRFTTRSLMVAVGICGLILWLIPICYEWAWTWTVIRDVRRGQSTRYSAIGFARAGPRAMQALRDTLKSDQTKIRMAAVQSLGVIGPDAKAAVPDLVDVATHDPDRLVRIYAAVSLGQIDSGSGEAVEPLIKLFRNEQDPQMIATIIQTFHDIGPGAAAAAPVLASIAKDSEHPFHLMAAWAICRIAPERRAEVAALVVPKLIEQLTTGPQPNTRRFAAQVLGDIGPAVEGAIPALADATEDQDKNVRHAAASAIEAIKRPQPPE